MPIPTVSCSTRRFGWRHLFGGWRKPLRYSIASALTLAGLWAISSKAAQLMWVSGSTNWDATSLSWQDPGGVFPPTIWAPGDDADFTNPSTITVTGTQVAGTVIVNEGSTITGGTISLNELDISNNSPTGQTVTINSNLTAASGILVIGAATDTEQLILTGTITSGSFGSGIARGTVTLQGASASFQMGRAFDLGGASVLANFNITGGASAATGGDASIATTAGGTAGMTLTGTGSSFLAGGGLIVGDAGNGSLTVNAGTTVTVLGALTIASQAGSVGAVTVNNGGVLAFGSLVAGSGSVTPLKIESGGTLRFTADFNNGNAPISFLSTGSTTTGVIFDSNGHNGTLGGAITGSNNLIKVGSGILKLTATNTYGFTNQIFNTTIQGGFIEFSALTNLNLVLNGGGGHVHTVRLDGGGLRWAPGNTIDISSWISMSSNGGSFDTNGNNISFATAGGYGGVANLLVATGTFTKVGAGTLTLQSPAANRTGANQVNGGVLSISSVSDLGSGSVGVATGGELLGTAGLSFNQATTVDGAGSLLTSNSFLEFGSGAGGNGTLAITNGATVSASATIAAGASGASGAISVTGTGSSLNSSSILYASVLGGTGTITVDSGGVISPGSLHFADSGGNGIFNLNLGGTLQVGGTNGILLGTGTPTFNFAGGTLRVTGSNLTGNVPMILTNTSTIDTNGFNATLSGAFSGNGTLDKIGAGVLSLSTAGSYSGGTNISGGGVLVTGASDLGTGPVSVTNGSSLASTANFSSNLAVSIDGASSALNTGTYLEVGFTGSGSVSVTNGGAVNSASTIALGLSTGSIGTATASGTNSVLNAPGQFYVGYGGTGTLTVSNGAVASGSSFVFGTGTGSAGTLNLNSGGTIQTGGTNGLAKGVGTATLNFAGGTIKVTGSNLTTSLPATLSGTTTINTNGFNATFSGALSGSGSLTKAGAGTLTLAGSHPYTGTTTITSGTLALSGSGSMITANTSVILSGGSALSLSNGASITTTALSRIAPNTGDNGTATIDGAGTLWSIGDFLEIGTVGFGTLNVTNGGKVSTATTTAFGVHPASSGTGSITGTGSSLQVASTLYVGFLGSASLAVGSGASITAGSLQLGSGAGGSGGFTINSGGTLSIGGTNGIAIGAGSGSFNFTGGTLKITNSDLTTSVPMLLGGLCLVDTSGMNATLSGILTDAGGIVKTGAGTLTMTGINTYSLGTTVNAGFITVPTEAALGTGSVSVTGGTLQSTSRLSLNTSASVDGVNSTLTTATYIEFGSIANGSLSLTNGALVSAGTTAAFGVQPGVTGTGNVTGTNSRMVTAGTLFDGFFGTGTLSVGSGGLITVNGQLSLANKAGGTGTFNLNTGGTLQVGGVNGVIKGAGTATFNFAGGLLSVYAANLTTSVPMTLSNSSFIDTSGATATLSGLLSGSGALSKTGAGTLTLSAGNTYTGGTTLIAGVLSVPASSALGTGAVVVTGGSLQPSAAFNADFDVTIDGTGSSLTSTSSLEFGPNVSGNLTVKNGGTLSTTSSAGFGSFGGVSSGTVTGTGSTFTVGTLNLGLFNIGGLTVTSGGTVTASTISLGGGGGVGFLTVDTGGTLKVGGTNGITTGGTPHFSLTGGTLKVITSSLTSAVPIVLSNTSTVDTSGLSFSLSGSVSGSGGLSKIGAGTFTLNGTNTYSGTTTIVAGTLESGPTGKFTASASYAALGGTLLLSDPVNNQFNVAPITLDGGTLKYNNALNGISQLFGNLTLADNATIDFGNGTSGNIFEFSSFTLAGTFTGLTVLNWNSGTGSAGDHLVFDAGTFGVSDLAKISFYNSAGQFIGTGRQAGYGVSSIQVVPEPSAAILLMAGLAFLGTRRRQRI